MKSLEFQVYDRMTGEVISNHRTAESAERKAKGDRYSVKHNDWKCDKCGNWYTESENFTANENDTEYYCEKCSK